MIALVGFECQVRIKWINMETTRNFENIQGGYINTNVFDYDLTLVANRVEIRIASEFLENNPLVMYPAKRINFIDGEVSIETPILTPESTVANDGVDFIYQILKMNASGQYIGNWSLIVRFDGMFNNIPTTVIGLFVISECTISGTESSVSSIVRGNILVGAIGTY